MSSLNLKHLRPLYFPSKPIISLLFQPYISLFSSSSTEPSNPSTATTTATTTANASLTQEQFTKINLLLPRLCLSNHLSTAIHLTTTALLTNPPPKSLSFSILIHSLISQPNMALSMSLLTFLKHNPKISQTHLSDLTTMLIASYFKHHKAREAFKVFNWMVRPGSPCVLDLKVCGILVNGFCRKGMVFEALKVLRGMVGVNLVPGRDLGKWVYRGLLREARIREAMELNEALGLVLDVSGDEAMKKVLGLLDHIIGNWTE
ncbi:hypothetical protein ACB092_07G049100 [Castanea dentata]